MPTSPNPSPTALEIDRLRVTLLRLARLIRANASSGDVTPSQMAVLGALIRRGRLTVGQIAELERMRPPSASKIVAALEQLGYVERTPDATDRRCTHISVTPAGHDFADSVRAAGRSWLGERADELDPAELEAIERALPALERLLGGTS